ncbi:MAG: sialidase family protein [Acidovorax sp.]|nr:sialidase family protein [Acidovorax sp.]
MIAENPLVSLRRPEVKATVRQGDTVWVGASDGLYRLHQGALVPLTAWSGRKIAAMATADEGLLLAAASADGLGIYLTDCRGETIRTLPPLPGDEPKSLLAGKCLLAGGKKGIYRLDTAGWTPVYGEGHTEVIGLDASGDRLLAFAKKQGPQAQPALIVSEDGGASWRIELETTYHDGILAFCDGQYITRWRGPWSPGQPVRFEKDAANAAVFEPGRTGWVAGNKLCVRFDTGARLDLKDPRFAEVEELQLLDAHAVVAGGNGAFLVDLYSGRVIDLFEGRATQADAAKVKKLWPLEAGRLLATASYGTFFSDDEGATWTAAQSDRAVLDAEGLALSPDGAWYLAAQRSLFMSWNNGASWKQVKFSTRPHFAELTALAFAGDRMVVGSKAGLFVSEPGMPKQLQPVAALGQCTIAGLLVEQAGTVLVGATDGRLARWDAHSGQLDVLAVFNDACKPLAQRGNAVDVLSAGALYSVTAGQVTPIAQPDGAKRVDAVAAPQGDLIAWNAAQGWRLEEASGAWTGLAQWPPHVKSVAAGPRMVVTDRSHVNVVG